MGKNPTGLRTTDRSFQRCVGDRGRAEEKADDRKSVEHVLRKLASPREMSMSKKRKKAIADPDGDGAVGDTTIEDQPQDCGAESILFEIAASSDSTKANLGSNKRSKSGSSIASTQSVPAADADKIDDAAAGAGAETSSAATAASRYHPHAIAPSSALRQCDGFDVVRKGGRGRGRQLMMLPGVLGLGNGGGGGRLGTLNISTPAHPVLYVDFPEGRLKCTGRTVHSEGKFFTLYADKAAGRATRMDCRDMFDSIVFFSKACWVGRKEDNPAEDPLPLPESLQSLKAEESKDDDKDDDNDGSGGAGSGTKAAAAAGGGGGFKTHFGGGNPAAFMNEGSKRRASTVGIGEGDDTPSGVDAMPTAGEEKESGQRSGDEGEARAPARRTSSRSTKSTKTYVEHSEDEIDEEDGGGSSSSSSDDENGGAGVSGGTGGKKAGVRGKKDKVVIDLEEEESTSASGGGGGGGGGGGRGGGGGGSSSKDADKEVFSILDAPTAKRKPVTIGSGRDKKAATAAAGSKRKGSGSAKGKGRRRRTLAEASSSSSDEGKDDEDGEGGGDGSGEESVASWEDGDAATSSAPSRRSRRSSAMSRVKYTQSSGSEEEDEEEEEKEEEEKEEEEGEQEQGEENAEEDDDDEAFEL